MAKQKKKEGLRPKQELFAQEYLIDLNATQAAIRAGYSKKTAYKLGSDLLQETSVSARVDELMKERMGTIKLDQGWVLQKLIECVQKSMQAEPVMKFDFETKEMVETGDYVYDSKGATKALELLGKHVGMFTNKVKLEGEVNVNDISVYKNLLSQKLNKAGNADESS